MRSVESELRYAHLLIGILVRRLGGEVVITAAEVIEAEARPPAVQASETEGTFTLSAKS
jgi:hypothetical protein